MEKKIRVDEQLHLALYLLKNRFDTPVDLIKYWAFSGPCLEAHPSIEDFSPERN
jgi:hypothetical protein